MKVLVLNFVILNDLIGLEDRVLLNLDHLVDQCLDDADAHIVVGGLSFVVD